MLCSYQPTVSSSATQLEKMEFGKKIATEHEKMATEHEKMYFFASIFR